MTKKLLSILAALIFIQAQALAVVTVQESTASGYLMNNGYSEQTAEIVQVSKARAKGNEYYVNGEVALKKSNGFVKFWRKLYAYFDPAAEDYSYYHHDTTTTPSYTDL